MRQTTPSFRFIVTMPDSQPRAGSEVSYVIVVSDRRTVQPIETGEGRISARTEYEVPGTFVKMPQVGQYRGTVRFPEAGRWFIGVSFRDRDMKSGEFVRWVQMVEPSTSPPRAHP